MDKKTYLARGRKQKMSEKVLGFKEKDVLGYSITVAGTKIKDNVIIVKKDKPVPVVSLQALRVFVEDFKFKNPEMEGANLALKHLLSWAENQGGEKKNEM